MNDTAIRLSVRARVSLLEYPIFKEDVPFLQDLNIWKLLSTPFTKGEDLIVPLREALDKIYILIHNKEQRERINCLIAIVLHNCILNPDAEIEP